MLSLKIFVLFPSLMCEQSARCMRHFTLEFVSESQVLCVIFILVCLEDNDLYARNFPDLDACSISFEQLNQK